MALLKEEILPRKELDELTDKKIRAITIMAYEHNQFLHQLFVNTGIDPHADIKGREDLLKAFRKGVKMGGTDIPKTIADYAPNIYIEPLLTSGTSGRPKKVLYSSDDINRSNRQLIRVWKSMAVSDGASVLDFTAPPPFATSLFMPQSLRCLQIKALNYLVSINPNASPKEKEFVAKNLIRMIEEFNPDYIGGGTSIIHRLPQFLEPYGFDTQKLKIKSVGFGAEPTTAEKRKQIGELWNAEPFEIYASTESSGIGYECNVRNGLHVNEPEVFIAAVDENGEEVGENEEGIDVVTNLYEPNEKPGNFFINYSHEDTIKPLGECNCGRNFKLIGYPRRLSEKIRIAGFGADVRDIETLAVLPPYNGEYVLIRGIDKATNRLWCKIRVETRGTPVHSSEDFKYALLASNPLALPLFNSSVDYQGVDFVEPGNLYKGYEQYVKLGKPTRVITIE